MKGLAMAGILAAATVVALPAEARADWRVSVVIGRGDHDRFGPRDGWRNGTTASRYGFDRGWRDGSREGRKDGFRARDPRFWREKDFRRARKGYKRWMGPRQEYMRGYRDGYAQGYRRAYVAARPRWRPSRDYDREWRAYRRRR